jgi:sugar transferase (PEP-CTERM/EpsH1 system associated)
MQSLHIVHLVFRFDVGGMENGIANLIDRLPRDRFRHTVVALTEIGSMPDRIQRKDVSYVALRKRPGHDVGTWFRFLRLLRRLDADLLHTRNLPTLEMQLIGALAGVRARIHGEHGRDVQDPDGMTPRYLAMRRILRPFVHRHLCVSEDLREWLVRDVGVASERVECIPNGVDTRRFRPRRADEARLLPPGFLAPGGLAFGTAGRLAAIKDLPNVIRAFARVVTAHPGARLAIVGDGEERAKCEALVREHRLERSVWLAGERSDVPQVLRALDVFVLGSRGEGMPNAVLEAMATGLPVVATRVGGTPELVVPETGRLVPPGDPEALADAMIAYARDDEARALAGRAARARATDAFDLDAMARAYQRAYESACSGPTTR